MKYFYFPMETMNVSQNYNGKTSHYDHCHNTTPKDYPIDICGVDSGQSACFAPVDMKITAIRGVGSGVTNTVWLESVEKVVTPTFTDYVFMTLTHWNDKDSKMKNRKVGDIIKKGQIICFEGTDGASGNHLHLVCGRGKSNNWVKNTKGKWVIMGNSLPPEQVMFINDDFTKCKNSGGLVFKSLPKIEYYPKCKSSYVSIVDALKSIGVDSSFSNRKNIAKKNGYLIYLGTASQNSFLLTLLKKGMLVK